MANEDAVILLVHFNDVYDVKGRNKEPVGGAARFYTAIKTYDNPIVLFSGDCFAPSLLSTFTKGEQMVPVLNSINTSCAVYGNHDFDFGLEVLSDLIHQTTFPWFMSNVIDKETNLPLGDGKLTVTLEHCGKKIGLIGLVEKEWLETLSTIDPDAVTYTDYVQAGNELAKQLRKEDCDLVIALTHMRMPNDVRLAENAKGIDLILGGHDHFYEIKTINGIPVVKSGTDFRDFSTITVRFEDRKPVFDIERVSVTSDYEEDPRLKVELDKYSELMSTKLDDVLGDLQVDLDGTFTSVRTTETNLGNFICDVMVASCNADCALLNSGALRSDRIHPAGPFTVRDLMTVLPILDPLVVLNVSGAGLVEALENGVSKYPHLEGRFPQVSGIRFAFDPSNTPGNRVDPKFVKVGNEYVQPHQFYRLVTTEYIAAGHDGFKILANATVLTDAEECTHLSIAVRNHFHAIQMVSGQTGRVNSRHHQSLITLSRRHSLLRSMSTTHELSRHQQSSLGRGQSLSARPSISILGSVAENMQNITCKLCPVVEGRIVVIKNMESLRELVNERKIWEDGKTIKQSDESGPATSRVPGHPEDEA